MHNGAGLREGGASCLVGEAHPLGEEGHEEAVGDHPEDEEVQAQRLLPAVPQVDDLWTVRVRGSRQVGREGDEAVNTLCLHRGGNDGRNGPWG